MFKLKPITPPRGTLDPRKYARAIQTGRGIAETAGLQEARSITRGWKHDVAWKIDRKGDDESQIVTTDEIFGYQDRGTKGPYEIRPRNKRALFWRGARHPVKRVMHPGLKAQGFSEKIAETMRKQYQRIMQDEIDKVIP
jgi:hypothetical protein